MDNLDPLDHQENGFVDLLVEQLQILTRLFTIDVLFFRVSKDLQAAQETLDPQAQLDLPERQ